MVRKMACILRQTQTNTEHALTGTPFIISHYPMQFEGVAIRNRELFTSFK